MSATLAPNPAPIRWTAGRLVYALRHPRRVRRLVRARRLPFPELDNPVAELPPPMPLPVLPDRSPLPVSAWGTEAARVAALEELAR